MSKFLWLAGFALLLNGCALFTSTSGQVVIKDDSSTVDVRIGDNDRRLIGDYYKHKKSLPPGLAKRGGGLPPGLAKRDKLPPGLQGESLPYDLEKRLSPLPSSYVRVKIGQDVVLMDKKTRVVLDVIYSIAK